MWAPWSFESGFGAYRLAITCSSDIRKTGLATPPPLADPFPPSGDEAGHLPPRAHSPCPGWMAPFQCALVKEVSLRLHASDSLRLMI